MVRSPVVALCISSGKPPGQEEVLDSSEPIGACSVCLLADTPAWYTVSDNCVHRRRFSERLSSAH